MLNNPFVLQAFFAAKASDLTNYFTANPGAKQILVQAALGQLSMNINLPGSGNQVSAGLFATREYRAQ